MYQYKMIPEESYLSGLARIDSFLSQGIQLQPVNTTETHSSDDILTEDELNEMIQESEN
jgi:hypothetical protein